MRSQRPRIREGRSTRSRLARVLLVPVLVVIVLATASSAPAEPAQRHAELPVVRWGLFKNYTPVYVAQAKGFFRQAGVRVEFVGNFTSGPQVVQAAGVGLVDAGHSAISGIANAVHAGVRVVGVADSQTEFKSAPLMRWFVRSGSGIRTGGDLGGKTIAVNSLSGSFFYTVLLYLHRHGLDKKDVRFVVVPHHNQEQALRTGQIDVAGLIDPYSIHIQQERGVEVLFRGVDVIGERQFSHVFFTRTFLEKRSEAARRFIRAYQRAIRYISTHPTESSSIAARVIGIDARLNGTHRYTDNARVKLADVQFWLDLMRQEGELRDDGKLKPSSIATIKLTGPAPRKPRRRAR